MISDHTSEKYQSWCVQFISCILLSNLCVLVETGPDGVIRYTRGGSDKDGKGERVRAFRD